MCSIQRDHFHRRQPIKYVSATFALFQNDHKITIYRIITQLVIFEMRPVHLNLLWWLSFPLASQRSNLCNRGFVQSSDGTHFSILYQSKWKIHTSLTQVHVKIALSNNVICKKFQSGLLGWMIKYIQYVTNSKLFQFENMESGRGLCNRTVKCWAKLQLKCFYQLEQQRTSNDNRTVPLNIFVNLPCSHWKAVYSTTVLQPADV